jgi:hypothetical protein
MTGKISGTAKGTMQESRLKHSVDVISQVYYLVIGFEVNGGPETFFCGKTKISRGQDVLETTACVHDIAKGDYGHAFFYTSDNSGRVINFFSFGPAGFFPDKVSDPQNPSRKDYAESRPSTASYRITELTKMFRFVISKEITEQISLQIGKFIAEKRPYAVWKNSTCASEARSVLSKAGVKTPNGSSKVNAPFLGTIGQSSNFDWYNFVNPYMWYRQMEEKYGKPIEFIAPRPNVIYIFIDKEKYFESDRILLEKYKWKLKKGDDDPLYRFPRASSGVRIHGKF